MSTITKTNFGQINFIAMLQNVASWMEMDKYLQKMIQSLILHMQNDWRWHGMSKIGIDSPLK
jgi:hypothetical protein